MVLYSILTHIVKKISLKLTNDKMYKRNAIT